MLLEYFKAKSLLDKYGIRSVESRYVSSAEDAVKFSRGNKIVLKVISEKQLHKSKAGLVKLGLEEEDEIKRAYKELEAKAKRIAPYKIIAQKMAGSGIEAIIGGREDPQFGKMILIGLGGIYVEAFKDFALRTCPITEYDASEMLDQLKSRQVMTYNGESSAMLTALLLRISRMLKENPSIKELDLNPVILRKDGYDVVDIRVLE
ncbi:MAG TPA: acetate--CoA ligase family protein [Candidatus Saccharimonadales bacterium]|nr:acetate--CoA ligase family protein [Candidatus Saccharimonadales bacterium]